MKYHASSLSFPTLSVLLPLFTMMALLSGCTQTLLIQQAPTQQSQPANLMVENEQQEWRKLSFTLVWPEGEPLAFSPHTLIAEQILAPVINTHDDAIGLWRFHRRANRNDKGGGHRFSFLYYTDTKSAEMIHSQVLDNPLTQWLIEQELIEKVTFELIGGDAASRMEKTSDTHWPMEIQRSWPYFIMGVSQTWLMLVTEISDLDKLSGEISFSELLSHYKGVNQRLTTMWQDHGQHAYLHHLNAIFGYVPLKIKTTTLRAY